jgi:hypothetical protein
MATSYGPQTAQTNEEPTQETSLDLTLTQCFHDEDFEPRKVRIHLEVEPPRAWYYHKSSNFHTLVILLQIDLLLTMNLKLSMKVVMRLKTVTSLCGLQFPMLDIIIGCTIRFVNCLLIARRIT